MFRKGRDTNIIVDKEGLVDELRRFFNSEANAHYASRGELMARALYLLHLDMCGEERTKEMIRILRQEARQKGEPFKEHIFLNSEDWMQYTLGQLEPLVYMGNDEYPAIERNLVPPCR